MPGGEHGCQNIKKCNILRSFYLNSNPTYCQLVCECVCVYVCMCAVSIRPLVIISKSIYEMPTFIHLLRRQLLAYGITLPAAFQGAPRSQPSEIMLSEWVTHRNVYELPRGVRDGVPVSMPERGGRQRRHHGFALLRATVDQTGFGFLSSFCHYFSFVRSVLSTSVSFSILFLSLQYSYSFWIAVLYLVVSRSRW